MEPISMGQKIVFACIISFVVVLCVTPLLFQSSQSTNSDHGEQQQGQDDRRTQQIVTMR